VVAANLERELRRQLIWKGSVRIDPSGSGCEWLMAGRRAEEDVERSAALLWERQGANGSAAMGLERRGASSGAAMGETGSERRSCYGSW
jgi:hypothetical protein